MTYRAEACPCCASREHVAYPALVSPFVASYALERAVEPTELCECRGCGFRYFGDRLTDDESARLYSGYRGERYYRERHRFEPWYTRRVNDGMGADASVLRARRELVDGFVRAHVDVAKLEDVLDFGGDRGQLIPPALGRRRFVHDISGAAPVDGVENLASTADLSARRFDLVLVSHVLEHCSEPAKILGEIAPLLRSSGSFVYVEVPFERPTLRFLRANGKGAYAAYLSAVRRARPLLMAVDLYSTVFRLRFDAVPPLGFVKLHEHINFFDAPSLRALFDRSGLDAVAIERLEVRSNFGRTPVLSALARPRRPR